VDVNLNRSRTRRCWKLERSREVLLLLGAAHSLNHSLLLALPPLLPLIVNETGASLQTMGLIATAGYFLYGAGALLGGTLSDLLGETRIVAISLAFAGLSTFIFIVSPSLMGFAIGLVLMSAWASLYHPTANSLISKTFQSGMSEAMGIHGMGGSTGQVLAPIASVTLGILFGWRTPFLAIGVLCILLSLLFLKVPFERGKRNPEKRDFLVVLKNPSLRSLLIYNMTVGLYFRGTELFFPTFLVNDRYFPLELAGLAATSILAAGILGQWLGGRGAKKYGSRLTIIASSIGVVASLLLLQVVRDPTISAITFVALYGVSVYTAQPASNSITGYITPEEVRGIVFGIMFFAAFGLGSASSSLGGFVADRYGLGAVFYLMGFFSLLSLLATFAIPSEDKSQKS